MPQTIGGSGLDVRISLAASRQHLHIVGHTETGKSTLLLNLITQDIVAGRVCAVLDPKGGRSLSRAMLVGLVSRDFAPELAADT